MQPQPRPPFDQLEARTGICVADGWGLKIYVQRGHLVVEDGVGQDRRVRRFHKATSNLTRLIIRGHSGYQTLEAARWLSDAKIGVAHIDTDGSVLTVATRGIDNPGLRRAQVLAGDNESGIEISRLLIGEKILGQHRVAARLESGIDDIEEGIDAADRAVSLDELRQAEMLAAVAYWHAWTEVGVEFIRADQTHIPEHWRTFGQRRSTQSASARRAINPINAVLNYLYALLEAEARLATISVGLDPGIGIVHLDKYARDSFALDLMEVGRPLVETYVLDLLEGHRFRAKDFYETRTGGCRVSRPLAHVLSETCTSWRDALAGPVEAITEILAKSSGQGVSNLSTPLTESNRREAKGSSWNQPGTPTTKPANHCDPCGKPLEGARKLCPECHQAFQESAGWLASGRLKLATMRESGDDPAHGGKAAQLRGRKNRAHHLANAKWETTNNSADPIDFVESILPGLKLLTVRVISEATGLSIDYCSKIRRGVRTPHRRHWEALAAIADSKTSVADVKLSSK